MSLMRVGLQLLSNWMNFACFLLFMAVVCVAMKVCAQTLRVSPPVVLDETYQDWGVGPLFHLELGLRGAASCAASSCHGGSRPSVSTPAASRGAEYPLWFESDPHAQSWKTLTSEASNKILEKLGIIKQGSIANARAYENCLACHNTSRTLTKDGITPSIAEGIGCELCHGPAQPWYDRHYVSRPMPIVGMTDIKPLVQRAKLCVACHVGSIDRDMNHDIIAAGHPALYFDMAVYHEQLPKHWREPAETNPDFRARLWLAGQIAMADAELQLMESRALKSHSVSIWPELSMYRCTDCHVGLKAEPRLPRQPDKTPVVGNSVSVRGWNLNGIESLSLYLGSEEGLALTNVFEELKRLLQERPPNASKIILVVQSLRRQVASCFYPVGDHDLLSWTRQSLRNQCKQQLTSQEVANEWEAASRFYVATWASSAQLDSDSLFEAMHTMRRALIFPNDAQSPSFPRKEGSLTPPNLHAWQAAMKQAAVGLIESDKP